MSTARTEGRVGHLIAGRYSLMRVVGSGGMGTVWAARDQLLGREVAVKEILARGGLLDGMQEARLAARVSNPHVVRVFDVVVEDGQAWIVMQLLPSRTLADVLGEKGSLPPRTVARMALDVLSALGAVHAAGVVHRDVKPGNVLLADDGHAVLVDFGIATSVGDTSPTSPAMLLGSPAYLPPERAQGGHCGPAGDMWSLGAMMFAAVQGAAPFEREEPVATINALLYEPTPYPDRAGALAPLITSLLSADPADRPGVDQARRVVLLALLTQLDGAESPSGDPPQQQPPFLRPRSGRAPLAHGEVCPAHVPGAGSGLVDGRGPHDRGIRHAAGTARRGTRQGRAS